MEIKHGEIVLVDFKETYKNVIKGKHPAIILSNKEACEHNELITVVPITSSIKNNLKTHVKLSSKTNNKFNLDRDSVALCEQPLTINRECILHFIRKTLNQELLEVKKALNLQLNNTAELEISVIKELHSMICELEELENYINKNMFNSKASKAISEKEMLLKNIEFFCIQYKLNINLNSYINKGGILSC